MNLLFLTIFSSAIGNLFYNYVHLEGIGFEMDLEFLLVQWT